ncbi:MAG: glycosyltransferase [Taibaiella sp.]|nr:glycosyltransferase [Taibaiella sp.]
MTEDNRPIRLSLVIPCYNEASRVGLMYNGITAFVNKWQSFLEIIIIDDGSTDSTYRLVNEKIVSKYKEIASVYTQKNTGKGGALRKGVLKATGDYILTLDADMASQPTELLKWLDILHWHLSPDTIYVGSREHKDSVITSQSDRKVAGNIFNLVVRVMTGLNIHDTQCGFKLYPANLAKEYFSNLQTFGWAHDVELLYKASINNNKIVEMPLVWNAIQGSKIRLVRDAIKMVGEVFSIVVRTKINYKK